MKVLIAGAGGQVGSDLLRTVPDGIEALGFDRSSWDISDRASTERVFSKHRPSVVINCAAYTAVDACETNTELAIQVNSIAPRLLAEASRLHGTRFIHLSTDYVFDGTATRPYEVDDPLNPRSVYGKSKAKGEVAVLEVMPNSVIVRTAWLYGPGTNNFPQKILTRARTQTELRVVDDQRGSPTWSRELARALWLLVSKEGLTGILHWTASGECSWYEFAVAIVEAVTKRGEKLAVQKIHPVSSAEFAAPAIRPAYSVLSLDRWNSLFPGYRPTNWREQLSGYLNSRGHG